MSSTFCLGQFIIPVSLPSPVNLTYDLPQLVFLQRGHKLVHIYCETRTRFGDLSEKQSQYLGPLLGPVSSCSTPVTCSEIPPNEVALVKLRAFLVTKNCITPQLRGCVFSRSEKIPEVQSAFQASEVELTPIWNYNPDVFFKIPHFTSRISPNSPFLLRNEHPNNNTKDLWYHDDNAWLRHYFDEESVSSETEPPEDDRSQGSILADDMGLGKTLTTLAFILSTCEEGRRFRKADPENRSLATLVICPLATLSNWQNEIKLHFNNHAITYKVFHGDD
ncbi:hypothetical protein PGT21_025611 [Puccinia graminis f. sp. tritici]|uniref:SNF2 N-terminal domain-containing protein n=1 Tax=Puccinia graminis f. sp. tritici TaxID=56615 RepID=A0A5B0LX71_PUCGR|nr:hypothetical protein PGTUg99_019328 [Puccinia graminis f. sp. tritici]KAA1104513.1 hypothetical protein PGT21_025611 [Puccinia graminis f. sp. tritici]